MQIKQNNSIKYLAIKLSENPVLPYSCCFDVFGKVPSKSTFSRFLEKLSNSQYLEQNLIT